MKIRFSTENYSLLSALIRWRTECKQSHVEFIDADGWTLGARYSLVGKILRKLGIKNTGWKYLDGVYTRPPEANTKQSNVIEIEVPNADEMYAWGKENKYAQPYDVLGILGIASAKGWDRDTEEFCSKFMVDCEIGIHNWTYDWAPQAVTPRDFLMVLKKRLLLAIPVSVIKR